jgi:hypothetical protein
METFTSLDTAIVMLDLRMKHLIGRSLSLKSECDVLLQHFKSKSDSLLRARVDCLAGGPNTASSKTRSIQYLVQLGAKRARERTRLRLCWSRYSLVQRFR